jgi:hypothetical protein
MQSKFIISLCFVSLRIIVDKKTHSFTDNTNSNMYSNPTMLDRWLYWRKIYPLLLIVLLSFSCIIFPPILRIPTILV